MYYIFTSADGFSYYLQGYDCLLNIESLEKKLIHVEEQERFVLTSTGTTIEVACTFFINYTCFHVACFWYPKQQFEIPQKCMQQHTLRNNNIPYAFLLCVYFAFFFQE